MLREEVIRRAQAGDRAAREELGHALDSTLRQHFGPYVGRGTIDDLVQNTLRDVLAKLAIAPTEPERFRDWVLGFGGICARRQRTEASRRHARAAKLSAYAQVHEPPHSPDSELLEGQYHELVSRYVKELPDMFRDALEYRLDGGNNRELAKHVGIPETTARWRVHQALKRIRRLIEEARVTRTPFRSPPVTV